MANFLKIMLVFGNQVFASDNTMLYAYAYVHAQSCLTFCDPIDSNLPGPLSMEFSKQVYWSELPFPTPGVFPGQGLNPSPLHCKADC